MQFLPKSKVTVNNVGQHDIIMFLDSACISTASKVKPHDYAVSDDA